MSYYCVFIGPSVGYEFDVFEVKGGFSSIITMPVRLKETDDAGNDIFRPTQNKVNFHIRKHDMGGIDYAYATYPDINPTPEQLDSIVMQVNLAPL